MDKQTSHIISQTHFPVEWFHHLFPNSEVFSVKELEDGKLEIYFNHDKLLTGRDPALVIKALANLDKVSHPEIVLEALADYLKKGYIERGINFYNSAFPYAMSFYSYSILSSLWKENYFDAASSTALLTLGFMLNYIYKESFNAGINREISVSANKLNRLIEAYSARTSSELSLQSEIRETQSVAVEKREQSSTTIAAKPRFFKLEKRSISDTALCEKQTCEGEERTLMCG